MAKKIEPRNAYIIDDIFNVTKKQQKKLIEAREKKEQSKNDKKESKQEMQGKLEKIKEKLQETEKVEVVFEEE